MSIYIVTTTKFDNKMDNIRINTFDYFDNWEDAYRKALIESEKTHDVHPDQLPSNKEELYNVLHKDSYIWLFDQENVIQWQDGRSIGSNIILVKKLKQYQDSDKDEEYLRSLEEKNKQKNNKENKELEKEKSSPKTLQKSKPLPKSPPSSEEEDNVESEKEFSYSDSEPETSKKKKSDYDDEKKYDSDNEEEESDNKDEEYNSDEGENSVNNSDDENSN